MSADPLVVEFEVAAPPAHAFAVWTDRCATWWPASHTVSGDPAAITFEPREGGRIYERTTAGVEHDWGEVTVWEPPRRLGYLWHLRRDRSDATEVEIRFVGVADGRTRVEIEHRGWEDLGAGAETWRDRNHGGWSTLLPSFVAAAEAPSRAGEMAG